jgi:hypothetical protein
MAAASGVSMQAARPVCVVAHQEAVIVRKAGELVDGDRHGFLPASVSSI